MEYFVSDLKGSKESLVNLISDIVDTEVAANKTEINIPFILPSPNEIGNLKKRSARSVSKSKLRLMMELKMAIGTPYLNDATPSSLGSFDSLTSTLILYGNQRLMMELEGGIGTP
ncbi:hypothetical protein EVAR_90693_1 [Eumeta japonica]|uniref:Uncharacterized protein n=1 Tax=Eumeta variegata TaxID=151549 RepID=A0A4C1YZP3_EUMVA|nr:hypothetical protein EVAR_90693_1 [Eumeta japonica]